MLPKRPLAVRRISTICSSFDPAGVARAAPIEGEGEGADDALRRAARQPLRVVDAVRHLPRPEPAQLFLDAAALDPVGAAAARAALDQREHQAGALRRAAIDPRAHRQRAVPAVDGGRPVLDRIELGAPDQRGVAEDPGVAAVPFVDRFTEQPLGVAAARQEGVMRVHRQLESAAAMPTRAAGNLMSEQKKPPPSNSSRTLVIVAVAVLIVVAIAGIVLAGRKAPPAPEAAVASGAGNARDAGRVRFNAASRRLADRSAAQGRDVRGRLGQAARRLERAAGALRRCGALAAPARSA